MISAIYRYSIKSLNEFDMLWVSHPATFSFFRLDWGRRNQYIVVWVLTGLPVFFESTSLMNEGDPKDREYWVQIITTISEISSTDNSRNRTTDKRIVSWKPRQDSHWEYPNHWLNMWCAELTILAWYLDSDKFDNSDDILQFQDHSKCAPYSPQYSNMNISKTV